MDLSQTAKKCCKFINEHRIVRDLKISRSSHKIIQWLDKLLTKLSDKYSIESDTRRITIQDETVDTIRNLFHDNPFMPPDITASFDGIPLWYCIYRHSGDLNVEIHCLSSCKDCDLNIHELMFLCYYVAMAFDVVKKHHKLVINIIDTPYEKCFPSEASRVLSPIHINSGSCLYGKFVNIWRREELSKVLIHELIHFWQVDMGGDDRGHQLVMEYIQRKFKTQQNPKIGETYTDLLAVILHSCYVAYRSNMECDSKCLLTYEINFILFQVAKIMNHYQMDIHQLSTYFDIVAEKTAVFAYFIVKAALLLNIEETLRLLDPLSFEGKGQTFIDLIEKSINSKFMNDVYKYQSLVKTMDKNKTFMRSTLRMTCMETTVFNHQMKEQS